MNDLLQRLERSGATGLDLSPGDVLAKEAAEEIRMLRDFVAPQSRCGRQHACLGCVDCSPQACEGCGATQRRGLVRHNPKCWKHWKDSYLGSLKAKEELREQLKEASGVKCVLCGSTTSLATRCASCDEKMCPSGTDESGSSDLAPSGAGAPREVAPAAEGAGTAPVDVAGAAGLRDANPGETCPRCSLSYDRRGPRDCPTCGTLPVGKAARRIWRVGHKVGKTLYEGDEFLGHVDSEEHAGLIVDAVNSYLPNWDEDDRLCATTEHRAMHRALREILSVTEHGSKAFEIAAAALPPPEDLGGPSVEGLTRKSP